MLHFISANEGASHTIIMPGGCIVLGCRNTRSNARNLFFHSLPTNIHLREKWLSNIKIKNCKIHTTSVICSKHFSPDCYEEDLLPIDSSRRRKLLKKGAVPKTFLFGEKTFDKEKAASNSDVGEISCMEVDEPSELSRFRSIGVQTELPNMIDSEIQVDLGNVDCDSPLLFSSSTSMEEDSDDDSDVSNESLDEAECENNNGQRHFFIYEECLDKLFRRCQLCGESFVKVTKKVRGALLVVKTVCAQNHESTWFSSKMLNRMSASNLLISAAILFTGTTYAKLNQFAHALDLQIISEKHFYTIQKKYLFNVINTKWIRQKQELVGYFAGEKLVVCGDGRCDSPGYCAKYLTYSAMEHTSNLILDFHLIQCTETGSSGRMEKEGCVRVIASLESSGIQIDTLVTDRHPQIIKVMRETYSYIDHQFDVWHVSKSIVKKLSAKAKKKDLEDMLPWIRSVANHLWWSAESCKGNINLMKERWESVIHHTANVHEWICGDEMDHCEHQIPIPPEQSRKRWLTAGSLAHQALVDTVLNKKLMKDIHHINNFFHTGNLESFHSMMLKYVPKRQHFSFEGMLARTQLAALDHNYNVARDQAKTSDGVYRYTCLFPKMTKTWTVKPIKVKKTQEWVRELMEDVVDLRLGRIRCAAPDVNQIPQNIALVPCPPKEELILSRASRFTTT